MLNLSLEEGLVIRSKAGEHAAFTELLHRNASGVRRAIRAIVPNYADAEDIMQDTMLKAYRALPSFDHRCKFSTWLTRIAINTALMHLRSRRRHSAISLETEAGEGEPLSTLIADNRVDTEQTAIRNQAAKMLREAVNALPIDLRKYMIRWYLDDVSHEEAAASLGITVAAGKSRSLRAKQRLEASLSAAFAHPA